ncbi:MAG: NADH-quinone oxidoreductase subunit J [Pirellulales bacterium]
MFLPSTGVLLAIAVTASACSLWLLLPRGRRSHRERLARRLGALVGTAALATFVLAGRRLGGLGNESVFLLVSLVAVISAAATIVSRSPVYAAIWFGLSLAGVAGILLVLGAQFLGVATIVVYAGAILVMFLFVLMLAQPSGMASYDRVSNEPLLSTITGAVLLGILSLSIGRLSTSTESIASDNESMISSNVLQADHVARIGTELFGHHLIAIEAAGVLLLIVLVGSIAIVARGEEARLRERRAP